MPDHKVYKSTYMLYDRIEAGNLLASKLSKYADKDGVIMAIPGGGVPVAYSIARVLGYPVDLALVKKIGHPSNKELAIAAASLQNLFVEPDVDVPYVYLLKELYVVRQRLKEMQRRYKLDKDMTNVHDKTVIIVDDGIATGHTVACAIRLLELQNPKKIIVATPVASASAISYLSDLNAKVIALIVDDHMQSVSHYYQHFHHVDDGEVLFYLGKLKQLATASRLVPKQ